MNSRLLFIICFAVLAAFLTSCVPARKVQRDGLLLDKNTVRADDRSISVEELEGFIRQQPNRKLLGFIRLNTFIYERSKWKWAKENLGKPPIFFDENRVHNTVRDMQLYLAAKGYFEAGVDTTIKRKKRVAKVNYNITAGRPYTLRNVTYSIKDPQLAEFIEKDRPNSLVKPGINYDSYKFDEERSRVTNYLRNNGYFYFNRERILFRVDSNLNNHQMDVIIEFLQQRERNPETGQMEDRDHLRYRMNHITINTDFRAIREEYVPFDTMVVKQWTKFPDLPYRYYFLYQEQLRIKPPTIDRFIFTRGGRFYRLMDANLTFNRLTNLPAIRFINMSFSPDAAMSDDGYGLLNAHIDIGRNPSQVYSIEAEGTNSGGFLGMGANLVYTNRNLLRGGEVFSIKLKGALEMQRSFGEATTYFLGFNTLETGLEARLVLPQLFLPGRQQKYTRHASPHTTFVTGFHFQGRPDYTRYILNFSFGYEWRETLTKSHYFIPAELNSVRISRSDEFTEYLNSLKDPRLIYQYTNHLVPQIRYTFTYNTQPVRRNRNFYYFRGSLESSGNFLNIYDMLMDSPKNEEGYYTKFGIRYAQFIRAETDNRYYFVFDPKRNLVFRMAGGVGVPLGNSDVLPVEKGFYAGGANGLRGWDIRTLGPGNFSDPENVYDRMGEIWIEGNMEYRFPVYSYFHGAVFADAGNIWLINENLDFPGGEFRSDEFYKQIAVDAGLGLRIDLSFFVFRVDAAIKLRDPARTAGNLWVNGSDIRLRNFVWSFGIGYPF